MHLKYRLQIVSIWTSLKFCRLVMGCAEAKRNSKSLHIQKTSKDEMQKMPLLNILQMNTAHLVEALHHPQSIDTFPV